MKLALGLGFFAMTLLCVLLLWVRARLALATTRLAHVEELAAAHGIGDAE